MSVQRPADLLFLYGPPAAGKYTIAKALAEELHWPLFHNHLAIDYVESLIKWGESGFHEACADVRVTLTERALSNGVSFVATFVYARGFDADEVYIRRLIDVAKRTSARICPVQLICSRDELFARCVAPHRASMGKISTVEKLKSVLEQYDCFAAIPVVKSLVIDAQTNPVPDSVTLIRSHFAL